MTEKLKTIVISAITASVTTVAIFGGMALKNKCFNNNVKPNIDVSKTKKPDGDQTKKPDGDQTKKPDGDQTKKPDGDKKTGTKPEDKMMNASEESSSSDEESSSSDEESSSDDDKASRRPQRKVVGRGRRRVSRR